MQRLLDKAEINIPCPKCGRKTKKTIGWVKTHSEYTCACGTLIHLKTDQLKSELAKIDKAVADFQRTFDKLKKI